MQAKRIWTTTVRKTTRADCAVASFAVQAQRDGKVPLCTSQTSMRSYQYCYLDSTKPA